MPTHKKFTILFISLALIALGALALRLVPLKSIPNTSYTIVQKNSANGQIIMTQKASTSSEGTLYFSSQNGGIFDIAETSTLVPNITLAKSADKTTAQDGDTITYTLTYQNTGTGDAKNVLITDLIPQGTSYVQGSAAQGGAYDGVQLTWTIPTLAPNAQGSVSFQVSVGGLTTITCVPSSVTAVNPSHIITITEKSGTDQENYPLQIGAPFIDQEIKDYPVVLINGTPLCTQADVKQRYASGFVKYAILSFLIPTLPKNASTAITFGNHTSGNNTPLNQGEMLDAVYDFDAVMELTNGTTKSVSAREMLQNNDFTYWTSGPIATTVILADHTSARKYDLGFDSYRPFRPIFHATFWPTINKVRVRFIGEITNTEELEDMLYDVTLKLGSSNPQTVYTKQQLTHYTASRWTKEFWIGGAPELLDIDG